MNLTVILPNISDREFILEIKCKLKEGDEFKTFKQSSSNFLRDLNKEIVSAKNDNILIVNLRDKNSFKYQDYIDKFRQEGMWINRPSSNSNKILSLSSSIKFNRIKTTLPEDKYTIRNLKEFMSKILVSNHGIIQHNIKKKTISDNNNNATINFYARDGKYNNRGPYIQSLNKVKYFKKHINTLDFRFGKYSNKPAWSHYLFPTEVPKHIQNYSIGPNIFLTKELEKRHKDKYVVADSYFMKELVIDKYNIPEQNVFVIPVYISESFYNTKLQLTNQFTVGLTGYFENDDIKNFTSLSHIAYTLPNIRFEVLTSRNPKTFPQELRNLKNIHFVTAGNDKVPNIMKKWNAYLSMSKRERGPAATQEARTMGLPIITPNHTGYVEFNNCIQLPIEPYKYHSENDKDLIISAISHCKDNYSYYLSQSNLDKEYFWRNEKEPRIISRKWENFFLTCIGEK